jgi:protein CWC15
MHKPTYFPVKGTKTQLPSRRTCIRDVTAHTTLKVRNQEQGSSLQQESLARREQFREQLLKKEQEESRLSEKDYALIGLLKEEEKANEAATSSKNKIGLITDGTTVEEVKNNIKNKWADDADSIESRESDSDGFDSSEEEDDDNDDDDDDSDDEAALQAELDKIRKERADAVAKKEKEDQEVADIEARRQAVAGNPLMNMDSGNGGSSKIKRRWNDDVVFANQSKDEPETKKRFINDVVRSDFHKSFMKKYMK